MASVSCGDILRLGGRIVVVVSRNDQNAAACNIIEIPSDRHRADIRLSWLDGLAFGFKAGTVVRCAPFLLRRPDLHGKNVGRFNEGALGVIRARVQREMKIQAREDAHLSRL